MTKSKETVVILCGGKGLRLRPITNDIPKPLIEIDDKPILEHIINQFLSFNFEKFIIATGYKSKKIEDFMKKKFKDVDYTVINSGDVNILERIRHCISKIQTNCILCYGDTLTDLNINKLRETHKKNKNVMLVSSYPIRIPFGVMDINSSNIVTKFEEKPLLTQVMNIGFFYVPKIMFDVFSKYKKFEILLGNLAKQKKLKSFKHTGVHITVNTVAELEDAQENAKKLYK